MEKIASYEEYQRIIYENKIKWKPTFTNITWPKDQIVRIISQGRLYVELYTGGIILFDDEELYYELVYYWNVEYSFPTILKDKPCVIKNVYRDEAMSDDMQTIEKMIEDCGFALKRKLISTECRNYTPSARMLNLYDFSKTFLSQNGMSIGPLNNDNIDGFRRMQHSIPNIPYYEIPFYTDDELLDLSKKGNLNIVYSKPDKEMCAYSQVFEMGAYRCGIIAIKEEYRDIGGIAMALAALNYERDQGKNIQKTGWVCKDNTESIRFHKKLGWTYTNKRMNEWVKD